MFYIPNIRRLEEEITLTSQLIQSAASLCDYNTVNELDNELTELLTELEIILIANTKHNY